MFIMIIVISQYSLLSLLRLLDFSSCSFAALGRLRWRIACGISLHPDIVSRLEILQKALGSEGNRRQQMKNK